MDPASFLLERAQMPATEANLAAADLALGRALLRVGQDYLARVSDEWDVDLFYEVYANPPTAGGWAHTIMSGLESRPDIPAEDRTEILNEALSRALGRLDGQVEDTPSH